MGQLILGKVRGDNGVDGKSAGFGTPIATATALEHGAFPTVSVTATGEDTAKIFNFVFGIPSGARGFDGKGFNPKGDWVAEKPYNNTDQTIDIVRYEANSYYCKQTHSGLTVPPSNDIENWGLFAEGGTSGEWFFGDKISGKNSNPTSFPNSNIVSASVGDAYFNTSNGEDRGNLYSCTTGGDSLSARWKYVGNVSTINCLIDNTTKAINYTIEPNTAKSFNADGVSSINIIIPENSYFGFISEINIKTTDIVPSFSVTNNSNKPFKFMQYGLVWETYRPKSNSVITLLFKDNGINIVCAILEL